MKLFGNILDEREKLEAMRVEAIGFRIVIFGLLAAMIAQMFFFGFDFNRVAGEWYVMMVGAIWVGIGWIRRGIWDYFTKPGMKSYIIYSLATGIFVGFLTLLAEYFRNGRSLWDCLRMSAISFAITFVCTFIFYLLFGAVTKARQRKLSRKYEGDNE